MYASKKLAGPLVRLLVLLVVLLLCFSETSFAQGVNITVDDQAGDANSGVLPKYSPDNTWTEGNGCQTCALHPNASLAIDNSWHDTTFQPTGPPMNITISFTGIAVYAFFIVPDSVQGDATVGTDLIFTLDGQQAGTFTHSPTGSADFLYNVPCFVKSGLSNSSHQLVISAASPDGGSTAVLFDYLQYTYVQYFESLIHLCKDGI
ncbi:uncharacterized protein FOMMEDRAFT_71938 [Fomitiporia mediterranea MF3/22]|uniref:uncharacterized protein n=1 Tax=Fomitiporia mediterranea (strain MF3/22) TaxID=694068 RepID=UPI00044083BA|nr:uncharacterized protein FOMMEDRAFT_71938 [Fomitiporia mediterranea MF3/22]EJD07322.1 hypothetical protein FOMMEDRAFT_71938 [Fomitiporia mediterranea MF3/22]